MNHDLLPICSFCIYGHLTVKQKSRQNVTLQQVPLGWKPNAFKPQLDAINATWNVVVGLTGTPHLGLRRLMPLYGALSKQWNAVGGFLTLQPAPYNPLTRLQPYSPTPSPTHSFLR
ncbi:hypothetical protein MRX96_046440 [Rhipicephalus microplus]